MGGARPRQWCHYPMPAAARRALKKRMAPFTAPTSTRRKSGGFAGEISLQRIAAATPPRNSSASGPLGMAHEILDIDHTHYPLRYPIEDRSGH